MQIISYKKKNYTLLKITNFTIFINHYMIKFLYISYTSDHDNDEEAKFKGGT